MPRGRTLRQWPVQDDKLPFVIQWFIFLCAGKVTGSGRHEILNNFHPEFAIIMRIGSVALAKSRTIF